MHNAMRAKTAPLGAHAVVIMESGIIRAINSNKMWSTGVALRYTSCPAGWELNPHNGRCYRLTTPGTWPEAEAQAVAAGGHLGRP